MYTCTCISKLGYYIEIHMYFFQAQLPIQTLYVLMYYFIFIPQYLKEQNVYKLTAICLYVTLL